MIDEACFSSAGKDFGVFGARSCCTGPLFLTHRRFNTPPTVHLWWSNAPQRLIYVYVTLCVCLSFIGVGGGLCNTSLWLSVCVYVCETQRQKCTSQNNGEFLACVFLPFSFLFLIFFLVHPPPSEPVTSQHLRVEDAEHCTRLGRQLGRGVLRCSR